MLLNVWIIWYVNVPVMMMMTTIIKLYKETRDKINRTLNLRHQTEIYIIHKVNLRWTQHTCHNPRTARTESREFTTAEKVQYKGNKISMQPVNGRDGDW